MMDANSVLKSCIGLDNEGKGKAKVALFNEVWNKDGSEPETINNMELNGPEINIEQVGKFWKLDIVFKTDLDMKLEILWRFLKASEIFANNFDYDGKPNQFPCLVVSVVPNELNGDYYLLGIAPVLMFPSATDVGEKTNTISILFEDGQFDVFSVAEEASEKEQKQSVSLESVE